MMRQNLKEKNISLKKYIRRQNARQEGIAGRQKPFSPAIHPRLPTHPKPEESKFPPFSPRRLHLIPLPHAFCAISAASPSPMEDDDDARSDSLSPSPPPSPPPHPLSVVATSAADDDPSADANGSAAIEPVTVAAPPHHTLTLALPIQRPSAAATPGGGGGGGGGGREDCWSEGATSTLIDAWGERYLELSRGNLKQKHWQEVADAVTSREGYTKTAKTDVQCKNRIDTLKKKYKIEKSKIVSGVAATSSWPFFSRLDDLLGPNHKPTPAPPPAPAPALPSPAHPSNPQHPSKIPAGVPILAQFPQRQRTSHRALNQRRRSPPSVSSRSAGRSADSSEGFPPEPSANRKRRKRASGVEDEKEGMRELMQAILRFGEVYERVESSKLQQAMEIEKQRMAFTKELELQRMQFFMKTQMELTQLKSRHLGGRRRRRRRSDEAGGSGNRRRRHHQNGNSSTSNDSHDSG